RIEQAKKELQEVMDSKNNAKIKEKMEALSQALYTLTTKVYQQAGSQAGGQAGTGAGPAGGTQQQEGNVYDADYKVVDDDKKE
ncbi:MAG: molecular chaperone DnaK, partial [Moorella sp. (in: Bacteria)]|nr:molecular chaperone DnaK [Moorella sp. (in: firmicutes)]